LCGALKPNTSLVYLSAESNTFVSFYFSLNTVNDISTALVHAIEESLNQNREMWKGIHTCITTNDLQQLKTLIFKNRINLTCFNTSEDFDTILHSAAKSNSVKMMEYILQRIPPKTKQQMLKMKNNQNQLPSDLDLLRVWAPSTHSLFPLKFRQAVKVVLMLGAKRQDGTPYYPQTHFYKLPKDVLFLILQYAIP
jgi:hypothetical protein